MSSSSSSSQPFQPALASFNTSKTSFAAIVPGLGDSDKLRVWNVNSSSLVGEWDIPRQSAAGSARGKVAVGAILWARVGEGKKVNSEGEGEEGRSSKKRRKSLTVGGQGLGDELVHVLSGNIVQVYSPTSPRPVHSISLPFAPQAVCSVPGVVGIVSVDSNTLILYDLVKECVVGNKINVSLQDTVTAISGVVHDGLIHVFIGSKSVIRAIIPLTSTASANVPESLVTPPFTAGIEPTQDLVVNITRAGQVVGLVAERGGRVVSALTVKNDRIIPLASLPLPTISPTHSLAVGRDGRVCVLSTSGEAYGFDLDAIAVSMEGETAGKTKKKRSPVASLQPDLTIKPSPASIPIVALALVYGSSHKAGDAMDVDGDAVNAPRLVVGLGRGVGRVVWETASLTDGTGQVRSEVVIKSAAGKLTDIGTDVRDGMKRYKEDPVGKAAQQQAISADVRTHREDIELPVDGELAEMTLADRLAVLNPVSTGASASHRVKEQAGTATEATAQLSKQNAQSLSRMLLQALHTSDPQLLDLILTSPANSSPAIVRNTIRKLPAAMALPLLKACVERLGQGAGARRRGGGRGGGLNERQGSNVVVWIRGVLVERAAILMTVPSLPVQLSGLTHLLENRLQLQNPLQALSGRLDLALEQIELRKSILAARSEVQGGIYIEGESDYEIEIEEGDGEGIVEDVRFASRRNGESASSDEERPSTKVNGYSRKAGAATNGEAAAMSDSEGESDEDSEDDADDLSDGEGGSGSGSEAEEAGDV